MGAQFQRARTSVGANRVEGFWAKLNAGLDDDERLVTAEMYLNNQDCYDRICGSVYLIRDMDHPDAGLEWIWENTLDKVSKQIKIQVVTKLLMVRLRLPWDSLRYEWLCSEAELNENRDDYQVLDVFVRVQDKKTSKEVSIVDPLAFQMNPDRYRILEIRYLVGWKESSEYEEYLKNLIPEYTHSVISE